jgi:hypothetical protein
VLLKRKPGMSKEEFNDYWLRVHGEIAKDYPNVLRYSQLHILESRSDTGAPVDFDVDGIVDFTFEEGASLADLDKSEIGRIGIEDAKEFIAQLMEVYVQEHRIVDRIG